MTRYALPWLICAALYAAPDRLSQDLNQFGTASYQQLAQGDGNLIFSPFSISGALSMTLAGGRGETAKAIAGVLHQNRSQAAYPEAFMALVANLGQRANGSGNELLNANGLWVDSGLRLEPDFLVTLRTKYQASLSPLDFARNLEGARTAINRWTQEHTEGKIRELFAPGSLDESTRLVLSSAVYFYGKWEHPFQPNQTRLAPFKLGNGSTVETSFMKQTGRFGYAETPTAQILEMKYAGTGLALDVLLPKPGSSLRDLEGRLTEDHLAGWLAELSDRNVEVLIPKFRVESQFSLREMLSRMGMGRAFTGSADFSGIDGRRDLALSNVLHKALVDVSEEGTEAAAATGSAVALVRMVVPEHTVFRADHPYVFLIRDAQSGLVLFAGRLTNPKN
jgi:serpin B